MRHFLRFAILTVVVLLIAACQSTPATPTPIPTDTPTPLPSPTATETPIPGPSATPGIRPETVAANPADQVYFQVIHAAPDSPAVDIYIELLAVATDLAFQGWTESTGITAGQYTVQVVPAGARLNEAPLLTTSIAFKGGKSLILVFTGAPDSLSLAVYEQSTDPLDAGASRVSTINAVPRGQDFTLRQVNSEITSPVSFGQESNRVVLASGSTEFIFQSGDMVLFTHPVNLVERHSYTFVLVGRPGDLNTLSVITVDTAVPGRSSIRVINASTTIGAIDVYLNRIPVVQNVEYPRASERQYVPTGLYDAQVYLTGANPENTNPITSVQLNTNPDDVITLVVVGSQDMARVVIYRQNLSATSPSESRIAFMNSVEAIPQVRVEFAGGPIPGVTDLPFGQVSSEVLVTSGVNAFYWTKIVNGAAVDLVETAENLMLEPGRSYLYLFTGTQSGVPLIFSDVVGIDQGLANVSAAAQATFTPTVPTNVRFVNVIATGTLVDFKIDDQTAASGIALGQGTPLVMVTPNEEHVFTVHNTSTQALLARMAIKFDQPGNYSAFVFGSEIITQIEMLVVPDLGLNFDAESPHLRLVNLTQGAYARFGLAYSEPTTTVSSGATTPEPITDANARPPLPIGVVQLVNDIEPNQVSSTLRAEAGLRSLIVLDSERTGMAARIPSVELATGVHYDVVAFQEVNSFQVRVYIVSY